MINNYTEKLKMFSDEIEKHREDMDLNKILAFTEELIDQVNEFYFVNDEVGEL